MNFQNHKFNSVAVLAIVVMCLFTIPLTLARNLEDSKNYVHDGPGAGSGKSNSKQFNLGLSSYFAAKRNLRSIFLTPKEPKLHGKTPFSLDIPDALLQYDEDDRDKRFDDYGHMRFGKRGGGEQFDDYGHMRFGRSI